uniref:ATP synthase F0 subunit 8 n=1 Tax=Andrena fulva TaxID=1411667 RepID=A0A0S2LT07_9HYME|nr:ATP synthase F0 subunit 8 [Andrena fulva]
MPQMKPMMWLMLLMLTLMMIMLTMIINFFSSMDSIIQPKPKSINPIKWKW